MTLSRNLAVLAMASVAFGSAAAAEPLKLGNEGNYPPFSITNPDGSLSGLEPDLAVAMCKAMQAECDIRAMEFSALLPALTTGKLDAISTQLFPTEERREVAAFTDPLLENPMAWVVAADWEGGVTAGTLEGKTVGTIKGNWAIEPLQSFAPGVEIREYDNLNQIILDMKAGRVDAGLAGRLNWLPNLIDADGGDAWKIEPTSGEMAGRVEAYAWAVAKGNDDLLGKMNAALSGLFEDCTYSQIRAQYFSQPTSSREPDSCQ